MSSSVTNHGNDGLIGGGIAVGIIVGAYSLLYIIGRINSRLGYQQLAGGDSLPSATLATVQRVQFAEDATLTDATESPITTIAQEVQYSGNLLEQQIPEAVPLLREVAYQQQLRETLNASIQRAGNAILESQPVERIVGSTLESV